MILDVRLYLDEKNLGKVEEALNSLLEKDLLKVGYEMRVVTNATDAPTSENSPKDIEEGHTDLYDAAHAKEWMEKHPHGYYNNEYDYGEECEDD